MNPAVIVAVVAVLAAADRAVAPPGPDDDRDWTRVQRLEPDAEIILTSRELKAARLMVVTVNDSEIVTRRSDARSDVIYRTQRASVIEIRCPRRRWRAPERVIYRAP